MRQRQSMYSDRGRNRGGFGSRGRSGSRASEWGNRSQNQGGGWGDEDEDDQGAGGTSSSIMYLPNSKIGVVMGISHRITSISHRITSL